MMVGYLNGVASAYAAMNPTPVKRQTADAAMANVAEKVSISAAARAKAAEESAASAEETAVREKLDAIKAKPAVERTDEERAYIRANDKRMAELGTRDNRTWSSADLDYAQKAGGFVNTMSALSDKERALYDEMVAQGNVEAAQGMNLVALTRLGMKGGITLANGRTFDPNATEITAANVRDLFRGTVVDSSGEFDRSFVALAAFLEQRSAAATNS